MKKFVIPSATAAVLAGTAAIIVAIIRKTRTA